MPTLNWIGKEAVIDHHKHVPLRLLECDPNLSAGDPDAGNLLVQGDNLEALKALLPRYKGQVKCIYIDPPYNTGNEGWIYNDNVNDPRIKKWLGDVVGKEAEDLCRHDKWLCMMYPRLALLKEFLSVDGAIFVSIDDNEVQHLRAMLDEIFGANNLVATLVWEKGKKGDAKLIAVTHEYIVAYARDKAKLRDLDVRWRRRKAGVDAVLEMYKEIRDEVGGDHAQVRKRMMAWYRSMSAGDPRKAHKHYNWSDDRGLYFPDNFHGPDDGRESRPRYDIVHPVTRKSCAKPSTGWRWEEERTRRALADTPPRIHFGPDETTIPNRKSYLFEVDEEPMASVFYKDGRAATLQVERLLGAGAFQFPKDTEVIADIVGLLAGPTDLVLDSFAGSGTTGHAVYTLNERDGGRRRFVLVELDPETCEARTRRRLEQVLPQGEGFRFCRLGKTLFNETGEINADVPFTDLARYVYLIETGVPTPTRPRKDNPLLGVHEGRAVYLLYNGVLGDKRPAGGNVLTHAVLDALPPHPDGESGPRVVYGEACRFGETTLRRLNLTFRQTPYALREA